MFVALEMVVSRRLEIHAEYQVSLPQRMPHPLVWNGNVTAAGSTSLGYGLVSAFDVLHGMMTSKSCETSE